MKTNKPITMKTKQALCGLLSGLLLLAAGTAQTHAGLLVPAAPGAELYVANIGNNTIEKFTTGGVGSVFASSGMNQPYGVAFDSAGNLYTSNAAGNTIAKFTPGGVGSVFASTGLNGPGGLAFDSAGNLYVGNYSGPIQKITPGGVVSLFVNASQGTQGMAFDSVGNLFVANNDNSTIRQFSSSGTDLGVFADSTDGLNAPRGLAFDSTGNLFVGNYTGNTIQKFTTGGVGSVFATAGVSNPFGLAFDSAGNLFVANDGTNTIRKFSSSGTDLGVFADSSDGLSTPVGLAFAPVPEPGTALFGIACVGVSAFRRRRSAAVAAKLTA